MDVKREQCNRLQTEGLARCTWQRV